MPSTTWLDASWVTVRDDILKTSSWWLKSKRRCDNVPSNRWRIHDALYDLTSLQHPGGQEWIVMTRGTDITELYESSHLNAHKVDFMLKTYKREDIKTPRLSPTTFYENGFYRTLKRRVFESLKDSGGSGPSPNMLMLSDVLLMTFIALWITGTLMRSAILLCAAGGCLAHVCGLAHNFYHQRNNWRMYCFDLSLLSSYEWRISHCYSHHCFPNQLKDAEVLGLEPFYLFLPGKSLPIPVAICGVVYAQIVNALIFHAMLIYRVVDILRSRQRLRIENGLPLIQFVVMWLLSPSAMSAWIHWNLMHATASWWFITMSLIGGAHHHPSVWHDGTGLENERDWGVCQLAAVIDRPDVDSTFVTRMTMFGDHALHHLFPTVDHSQLKQLRPILQKTCQEFNITSMHKKAPFAECFIGFFSHLYQAATAAS